MMQKMQSFQMNSICSKIIEKYLTIKGPGLTIRLNILNRMVKDIYRQRNAIYCGAEYLVEKYTISVDRYVAEHTK